ncbi:hypothetical protein Pint_30381 [Pistacia integerrima]|uniref:Uncharacterized protein n=1 Tax=Pistacia integerrima TaxID=434235 RepID=A0ACC0WZ78_9ROSI|nr:hypothetical protein Pint_30381 [Pistacia integerrima]
MVKPSTAETPSSSHSVSPLQIFFVFWVIESPIVILLYSYFRKNPDKASYFEAVVRGLLGIPVGALVNDLGAIALCAPVGIQYMTNTFDWSLLMLLFTRMELLLELNLALGQCRLIGEGRGRFMIYLVYVYITKYLLNLAGLKAGLWFLCWMNVLFELFVSYLGLNDLIFNSQEWPICVSYGAMAGYLIGMVASFGFVLIRGRQQHQKVD